MPDLQRMIRIKSALGPGKFLLRGMTVTEALGEPFVVELAVDSDDQQIDYGDILGQHLTVEIDINETEQRYFDGIVTKFSYVGLDNFRARYEVILYPWIWQLHNHIQFKIFQQKDVPTIIKEVFRAADFDDFEDKLQKTDYLSLDYCVQYRESDFDFVNRLMEQEGIYYYFSHSDGSHKLVLCDAVASHGKFNDSYGTLKLMRDDSDSTAGNVWDWSLGQEMKAGQYTISDYDFEKPNTDLTKSKSIAQNHTASTYEIYDYPGKYTETADGTGYSALRMEREAAKFERARATSRTRWLATGCLVTLNDSTRDSHNGEYLIVGATMTASTEAGSSGHLSLLTRFEALGTARNFRSPPKTPKPFIRGPQTAFVVGKSGEEIWTDSYGRVKIQFHWDRDGQNDESSSCWVRCAQAWAGKQWGMIFIPRIGQEVIVHFLEGDPDRPIITGAVYNASSMPPYALTDNQTQSGVKSNSSKGGNGSNEIRFEDKAGSEDFYLHAQKDMHVDVINDWDIVVEKGNETHEVSKGNLALTVKQGDETHEVTEGSLTLTVKQGAETHEVSQGNRSVKVGQGTQTHEVFGDCTLKVTSGNYTLNVVAGSAELKAPQGVTIESTSSVTLKVGANSITIGTSGITISGTNVSISADIQAELKGMMTDVKADSMLQVKGSITMVG